VLPGVVYKPRVAAFTPTGVLFTDNTSAPHIDTVVLATGYEHRVPFLSRGGLLPVVPRAAQTDGALSTCLRYVRPLFRHSFALDPRLPPTALAFVGLPIFVANAVASTAQALVIGHAIADASVLPSRAAMLADLHAQEDRLRAAGLDPGEVGHRLVSLPRDDGELRGGAAYQDDLVRILQDAGRGGVGGVPPAGRNFTDAWRTGSRDDAGLLRRAWDRVESEGAQAVREWIGGVETEEEWVEVMRNLVQWERGKEGAEAGDFE
jgi:hypothetical protein